MLHLAAFSLAAAPPPETLPASHLPELTPTQSGSYDYWQEREIHNESFFSLPHLQPLLDAAATTATTVPLAASNLRQTWDYVRRHGMRGTACHAWCAGDVKVDRAAAEAMGPGGKRTTFPKDDLAQWDEKCSWDEHCSGCSQCDDPSVTCDAFCAVLNDAKDNPEWKVATVEPSTTCNWGPCHGCDICVKETFEVFEAVKAAEANLKAATTEAQVKGAAADLKEAKATQATWVRAAGVFEAYKNAQMKAKAEKAPKETEEGPEKQQDKQQGKQQGTQQEKQQGKQQQAALTAPNSRYSMWRDGDSK